MSLNIIVVAVILIAILVIILIMVGSKTNIFSKSAASCESKGAGARCMQSTECIEIEGVSHRIGTDCSKRYDDGDPDASGPVCCVPMAG